MKNIYFSLTESGIEPNAPQHAGVQGEHNATSVTFTLPQAWLTAGYAVRAEMVDGAGAFDTTPFLDIIDGAVSVALPLAWTTAGGLAELRLAAAVLDGNGLPERAVAYSPTAYLYFESRMGEPANLREFPNRGLSSLIADCMSAADVAKNTVLDMEERAKNGEFDGDRGPKGEKGDKGDQGPQGPRGERGFGMVTYDTIYENADGVTESTLSIPLTIAVEEAALFDRLRVTFKDGVVVEALATGGGNFCGDLTVYGGLLYSVYLALYTLDGTVTMDVRGAHSVEYPKSAATAQSIVKIEGVKYQTANDFAVQYNAPQTLTEAQKVQAKQNIGIRSEYERNPANLITDEMYENFGQVIGLDLGFSNVAAGIEAVEMDAPCYGIHFTTAGQDMWLRFPLKYFQSGKYVIKGKISDTTLAEARQTIAVEVAAIGTSVNTFKKDGITSANGGVEFDVDIEAFLATDPDAHYIRFYIADYYGEMTLSELYIAPYNENGENSFWLGGYEAPQTNPLYGKVISFNGDSICEGAGDSGGYAKYIGENNKMTVENIGVSGGTIAYSASKYAAYPNYYHCISRSVAEMREDADYIILEGGVNDLYNSDITLGSLSNGYNSTLDDTTFYGAFENMLKQALIRFPGKKIGYIAVHKMTPYFDSDNAEDNAYHAAIKCCAKWGIPMLDLNKTVPPFGYLRNNADTVFLANTYTADTATAGVGDGWHPNAEGYKKYYVPKIEAWLKTL